MAWPVRLVPAAQVRARHECCRRGAGRHHPGDRGDPAGEQAAAPAGERASWCAGAPRCRHPHRRAVARRAGHRRGPAQVVAGDRTAGAVPDIHGLALRLVDPARPPSDLLLATTGWSRLTRVVLLPGLSRRRAMTSLLPYATPSGSVLLGAMPASGLHLAPRRLPVGALAAVRRAPRARGTPRATNTSTSTPSRTRCRAFPSRHGYDACGSRRTAAPGGPGTPPADRSGDREDAGRAQHAVLDDELAHGAVRLAPLVGR